MAREPDPDFATGCVYQPDVRGIAACLANGDTTAVKREGDDMV
jgi:hypothetical protein